MTREEIRRENARRLAREIGGPAAFGRKLEMSDSQVSQIIGKTPKKNIGNSVAERIEDAFKRSRGWLDIPQTNQLVDLDAPVTNGDTQERRITMADRRSPGSEEVEIPQYKDIGGGMGGGVLLRDQPGEIHGWRVTPEWINKNVKTHSGAANLRIVTGFGDSMRPLYNPGDPLLVDIGVTRIESDAIYFFRVGEEGFIKRLQRVPGIGVRVLSENKAYEPWTISPEMDFEVFAIVIKVWCGTDFW